MVKIKSEISSGKAKNVRFLLNYPKIQDNIHPNFAKQLNGLISNDISIFQEIVEFSFEEADDCTVVNALSEFQVAFNKNNLISIPVEFSQIVGLTDISHIYSYNYDFDRQEKIALEDLFIEGCDYESIIEGYIIEGIYEILAKYNIEVIYDLMAEAIYICDNPVFYFNERELVICISSFELMSVVCNLIEFPIDFNRLKGILSDYAIEKILNK